MIDTSSDRALIAQILQDLEDDQSHHQTFKRLYEKRERAYRGVKERVQRDKWNHTYRPAHAFNLLETVVASQTAMGLKFDVRPSPHSVQSADEAQHMLLMAEDVSDLLRHEHRLDQMDWKQRPLFLCDGIGGVAIGKDYWNYTPGSVKRQESQEVPIYDAQENVIGTMPTIVEIERDGVLFDHSTTEVVDPRDFIWHEAATNLNPRAPGGAQHVMHRCWYSYEQLLMIQATGLISGVEQLKESRDYTSEYQDRNTEVFNVNRAKDMIEVIEYWWFEGGKIYYAWLGGRKVLLMPKTENPYWHGMYPFFMCSSMPQPFSMYGTSTIELVEDLQEILWELGNQRLDNIELINNAITLIRSDVDDPDAYQHFPGARWEVDDPAQVEWLQPPYQLGEVSIGAEQSIRQDMQTVTSAAPLAGGQDNGVGNSTATGASLIMNAAQTQLAIRKHYAQKGLQDEANMRIKNCQQFLTGKRLVQVLGPAGAAVFKDIDILAIQGEYIAELTPMSESEQRAEKRAEAGNFSQLMMGFAPLAAAAGESMDVRAVITWFCKQWDIEYPEQFFAKPTNAAAAGAQQALPGSGGPGTFAPSGPPGSAPPGAPNMGTTAATAVDASKPSATGGNSMSPQMFLQRAAALSGGPQGG